MQAIIASVIFIITIVLFVLQKIPAGLTAMIGALLMMVCGIITPKSVVSNFGSDTVIMVAAVMILGNAVFTTGAANRIGQTVLKITGTNERKLVFVLVIVVALLSAFLSNSAVVAIFLPLLASLARCSDGKVTKKGTYMAVGIASVVGGNCTLAGSTPQLTAQAILQSTDGVRPLTFWELGAVGLPLVILLGLYYLFIGVRLQQKMFDFPEQPDNIMQESTDSTVQDKKHQNIILLIMLGCIVGFSTGVYSFGTVASIAAVLCILTGCISYDTAFRTLDWNTILVLGGAMGISNGVTSSGLMDIISNYIITVFGGSSADPTLICTVLLTLSALLGNAMSHTASAAILTPLAISLGFGLGVDPIPYVVAVVIGCNLAFITPVATPPLTMTLVGGYRFTDYIKVGGIYNLLSVILAAILIPLIYAL